MKEQGLAAEKRARYSEADRLIMEHCWQVSAPYRESLVSRVRGPSAGSEPRASVLEMLQGAVPV